MQHTILRTSLFFILAAGLWSCGSESTPPALLQEPIAVATSTPVVENNNGIQFTGQLVSLQTAQVSSRVMGTITSVTVDVGAMVKKGQLLATISSDDIRARVAQTNAGISEAEANLANARKDLDRFTQLYQKQSASAKEMDNITLQYNAAKARVEAATQMRQEANSMLAYTQLRAPFDGVATQRNADVGDLASPGLPILTIEQSGELLVEATVSESDIAHVSKTATAQVPIKSARRHFSTRSVDMSSSARNNGGQYLVKLAVPAAERPGLYAGMYTSIFIPSSHAKTGTESHAVLIPTTSLIKKDQLTGIYTISSRGTALLRWIRTGKELGEYTEVLSGLAANEKFITKAEGRLYNGVAVREK